MELREIGMQKGSTSQALGPNWPVLEMKEDERNNYPSVPSKKNTVCDCEKYFEKMLMGEISPKLLWLLTGPQEYPFAGAE